MGQLHNELRRTAISRALKLALGDSKSEGGIERYSETLTPILDLWDRAEWAFLRQEALFARFVVQGAVVGEFSGVGIANPVGSGKIVVVTGISAGNAVAAGVVSLALTTRALLAATYTIANPTARDTRWPSQLFSVPEIWFGSDAAGLAGTLNERVASPAAGEIRPFTASPPWVLTPSFGLVAEAGTANQGVSVNYAGYCRNAFPGELI